MKSFDKWVDELHDQVNKKPELPDGIVEGNVDGEYLYQCRACGDWNPIDWDLDEDSYEGHYCGKQPSCCPLPNVSPGPSTRRVSGGTPLGGKPIPPPPPPAAPKQLRGVTHVTCPGCNLKVVKTQAYLHPMTGDFYCGAKNCEAAISYKHMSTSGTSPAARAGMMHCPGCNQLGPINSATMHRPTGLLFCGRNSCRTYMDNLGAQAPTAAPAKPKGDPRVTPPPPAPPPPAQVSTASCAACGTTVVWDKIVWDKVTGAPTCGRHTCMAFLQKRSKLF